VKSTPEGLSVDIATESTGLTATLDGELDLATGQALVDTITAAVDWSAPGLLTLDFAGVNFCDSVGVSALVRLRKDSETHGWQLRIINTQHPVRRMLVDFTGLGEYLNVA
jgi:anti-anti-sigma factor